MRLYAAADGGRTPPLHRKLYYYPARPPSASARRVGLRPPHPLAPLPQGERGEARARGRLALSELKLRPPSPLVLCGHLKKNNQSHAYHSSHPGVIASLLEASLPEAPTGRSTTAQGARASPAHCDPGRACPLRAGSVPLAGEGPGVRGRALARAVAARLRCLAIGPQAAPPLCCAERLRLSATTRKKDKKSALAPCREGLAFPHSRAAKPLKTEWLAHEPAPQNRKEYHPCPTLRS